MQVATKIAKQKILGQVADRVHENQPSFETDPEIIAATQEAAAQKKQHWYNIKKVKATPDLLLNKEERNILLKVKKRAWYLDKGCHCCCFNIGLDGIIGFIPGIGDVLTAAMALQLIRTASKANLPKHILSRMMMNVMFDFMLGLTPIAGDILDIFFKCNWRNAMLLEEFLINRRMDEIRLEKGNRNAQPPPVEIHDDNTIITKPRYLDGGDGSSTADATLKKPAPPTTAKHHHHQYGAVPEVPPKLPPKDTRWPRSS
ncbi:hypothetical protein BDF20DRAFT_955967 [Mycotypha africana]|uniref:uncharacterized protein n=1 Tax=Mycotypha africana TaxID=64632 RepID=UPI0023000DE4|nr:uncharacterized protein BDF20DRAFT_955967 [Mycotypha africana]KAI8982081.1 hypothetical protein BDF20DRAFT_955967 [Mycotypha africana]